MRSFRTEFDDLFAEGLISAVEIGLGASGELKYPSFSERMGWRYPGIGEFQVSIKPNYPLDAYTYMHTCMRLFPHFYVLFLHGRPLILYIVDFYI